MKKMVDDAKSKGAPGAGPERETQVRCPSMCVCGCVWVFVCLSMWLDLTEHALGSGIGWREVKDDQGSYRTSHLISCLWMFA